MTAKHTPPAATEPSSAEEEAAQLKAKTIAQARAKLEAYHELKEQGLPIPRDLALEIQGFYVNEHGIATRYAQSLDKDDAGEE